MQSLQAHTIFWQKRGQELGGWGPKDSPEQRELEGRLADGESALCTEALGGGAEEKGSARETSLGSPQRAGLPGGLRCEEAGGLPHDEAESETTNLEQECSREKGFQGKNEVQVGTGRLSVPWGTSGRKTSKGRRKGETRDVATGAMRPDHAGAHPSSATRPLSDQEGQDAYPHSASVSSVFKTKASAPTLEIELCERHTYEKLAGCLACCQVLNKCCLLPSLCHCHYWLCSCQHIRGS